MDLVKQQLQRPLRLAQCRPFTWLLTLLLTAILVACAPPAGEPGVEVLPTNTPPVDVSEPGDPEIALDWVVAPIWQLVRYGPADNPTPVLEGTTVTLNFEADGQLNGLAGCNQYSGSYELDDRGSITISPLVSTRMACMEDGVMEQEAAFLQALESAHSLSLVANPLLITYEGGELLFVPREAPEALPLEGTEWRLETAVTFHDEVVSALPVPGDLDVTLLLEDGQLGGFNGCNSYGGEYTLANGELRIAGDSLFQTLIACLDEIPSQLETQMMTGLHEMESYDIIGDRLTITYPGGELIFTPKTASEALPLEGIEWRLETAVQTEGDVVAALLVPDELAVTLWLENGELSGFNGCNTYGGNYTLENGELHIDEVFQTLMDCGDNMATEVEAQMRLALPNMESYEITGNRLTITHPGGELIFVGHR
jgi:heat shock protein HslJ